MVRDTFASDVCMREDTFTSSLGLDNGCSDGMSQFEKCERHYVESQFASNDCMNKYTCIS